MATITQGDFSVFGFFETREAGRWGEGGSKDGTGAPATYSPPFAPLPGHNVNQVQLTPGAAAGYSGGSFDFNHWDLVEARQLGDIRPDYHMVKNYKFLGRFDTLVMKDADFFAFYRPWYDAFGSIKRERGRAEPARDWGDYSQRDLQAEYFRNDLREFYGQLNFTDNFSMRVGKQQIIWSEADALSGTEVTNPADLRYHWVHFETPENQRVNVRMVKFNYIFPDFLKTANNEAEFVWIPGDFQGDAAIVNTTDARNPYIFPGPLSPSPNATYNSEGQPIRDQTFLDNARVSYVPLGVIPGIGPMLAQEDVITKSNRPRNTIDNSEFAFRYSSLLPIGSGLQASFIYLYEARLNSVGLCTSCPREFGTVRGPLNFFGIPIAGPGVSFNSKLLVPAGLGTAIAAPGLQLLPLVYDFGFPNNGATLGTLRVLLSENYRRNHFFGLTGTYYDKELTDMVFRYDTLYAPSVAVNFANPVTRGPALGTSSVARTQQTRFILAGDRPTYIPWISKQHTFLVFQYVNTWFPDRPANAVPYFGDFAGKLREDSSFFFVSAVNWVMNGQLTTTNTFEWDADNICGAVSSTNVYRYSRNVLLGFNAQWYLGRSARFTDPFSVSRGQRINEVEATLSYEI